MRLSTSSLLLGVFFAAMSVVLFSNYRVIAAEGEVSKRILVLQGGENVVKPDGWHPYQKGFQRDGDAWLCVNGDDLKAQRGVSQTIVLDQTKPSPFVATAWSRSEGVTGSSDGDYSIYLDITYADGTNLWGQISPFAAGTHDWQQRRVAVIPDKPVKAVHFNLLLRNHGGRAWFRAPELRVSQSPGNAYTFDGLAIQAVGESREGFQIRDVAAGGDFLRVQEKPDAAGHLQAKASGINLQCQETRQGNATFFDVTVTSEDPAKDRAITLLYAVPVTSKDLQWLNGQRHPTAVEPGREYIEAWGVRAGRGRLSRYPLAAVANSHQGTALGIDMARPAIYRAAYHAGTQELYLAYDIGLTREKPTAKLRFCRFEFEPSWGFRAAFARFYDLFPEQFRCRTPQQGNWMPFAAISKVKGWEDFGFKFKEGNDETKWDDEHGIVTFRYTEPMTWWMAMPKEMPRTIDAALAEAKRLAAQGNQEAKALLASGMFDAEGKYAARLLDTPWCNGAVWSMNSMPGVRGEVTDFKNKWSPAICESLYGPKRNGDLDGEYIDSSEGYVTEELDFRREHFGEADAPLTFSPEESRPAIYRGLVAFEYARGLADDVHKMGKLMMANGTPCQVCWLVPLIDVMGTETDWNPEGHWQPMADSELFYRRILCKGKPYCFLMNTKFENFPKEKTEKFMQRSLAYGMFPGFFSADASTGQYFTRPELYERDRPLFKKYLPLCKLVAEAGWQPITGARSSDEHVYVERFGRYLTVFNDSPERCTTTITLEGKKPASSRELVGGGTIAWNNGAASVSLDSQCVAVIELP